MILESANGMLLKRQLVGTSQGTIPKCPTTEAKWPVWAPLAQLQVWKRSIEVGAFLAFCFWLKRWARHFLVVVVSWFQTFFGEFSFLIWGRFLFWTYFKCFNWPNLDQQMWVKPSGLPSKDAMNWLDKNSWFKVVFSNVLWVEHHELVSQIASQHDPNIESLLPSTFFKNPPVYHVKMWLFGSLVLEMRKLPEYEHLPSRGYLQKTTTSWTTQLTFEYVTY